MLLSFFMSSSSIHGSSRNTKSCITNSQRDETRRGCRDCARKKGTLKTSRKWDFRRNKKLTHLLRFRIFLRVSNLTSFNLIFGNLLESRLNFGFLLPDFEKGCFKWISDENDSAFFRFYTFGLFVEKLSSVRNLGHLWKKLKAKIC